MNPALVALLRVADTFELACFTVEKGKGLTLCQRHVKEQRGKNRRYLWSLLDHDESLPKKHWKGSISDTKIQARSLLWCKTHREDFGWWNMSGRSPLVPAHSGMPMLYRDGRDNPDSNKGPHCLWLCLRINLTVMPHSRSLNHLLSSTQMSQRLRAAL